MFQIYAYEINKLLQPSTRPRQIFPYAVVTYTENGAYVPAVDAKPTAKEKLAGNPRLQEIIKAINAKAESSKAAGKSGGSPSATPGVAPSAGLLQGPAIIAGSPSPTASAGSPGASAVLGGAMLPGLAPPPPCPQSPQLPCGPPIMNGGPGSSTIPTVINGQLNGAGSHPGLPGMTPLGHPGIALAPGMDTNPQLKAIISQINARLESEQKLKPGVVPAVPGAPIGGAGVAPKGDGLLPSPPLPSATPPGQPVLPVSVGALARPPSQDGIYSASVAPPSSVALQPGLMSLPGQLAGQRMLGLPETALKGAPLTAFPPATNPALPQPAAAQFPGGVAAAMSTSAQTLLAARKNPLTIDPLTGQYQFSAGLQQAAALQGLSAAGAAPRLTAQALPTAGLPHGMPLATMPTYPTMSSITTAGTQAAFGLGAGGYQFMGALPTVGAPSVAAAGLTPLQQNPLTIRTALKRPFPDPTAGLLDWDKRPKLM